MMTARPPQTCPCTVLEKKSRSSHPPIPSLDSPRPLPDPHPPLDDEPKRAHGEDETHRKQRMDSAFKLAMMLAVDTDN